MAVDAPTVDNLKELRRAHRAANLRLETAQANLAYRAIRQQGSPVSTMEDWYDDTSNRVDYRDYLAPCVTGLPGAVPTTRTDRDLGRNFPFFRTEMELALIRGMARLVAGSHPTAVGAILALKNYVIGQGFKYNVRPKNKQGAGLVSELVKIGQKLVDSFIERNKWCGNFDRELFERRRVDGENFPSLWHVGNGEVECRAVEPDQITEPGGHREIESIGWLRDSDGQPFHGEQFVSDWTFGIHSDADDACNIHGLYVQWNDRELDWDYLPSGRAPLYGPEGQGVWCEPGKTNVVRSVKRGLSDFFCTQQGFDLARKVLRNVGEGASIQAAIAWIKEVVPGTTQSVAQGATIAGADYSYQRGGQSNQQTAYVTKYESGTTLTPTPGTKYIPGPLGNQSQPNYLLVADALLRSFVAVRWNMPEHFITGSAENNNYASSIVAESPFVKNCQAAQREEVQHHQDIFWRVLYMGWMAGRFGDISGISWTTIRDSIEILIEPPQIETRDPKQQTEIRQILNAAGRMSGTTWSQQEGLDPEQEQANFEHERKLGEKEAQPPQAGQKPGQGPQNGDGGEPAGDGLPRPPQPASESVDAVEDVGPSQFANVSAYNPKAMGLPAKKKTIEAFDESKHPRGQPKNKGEFGPGGGGKSAVKSKTTKKPAHKPKAASKSDTPFIGDYIKDTPAKAAAIAAAGEEKNPAIRETIFARVYSERTGMSPAEFKQEVAIGKKRHGESHAVMGLAKTLEKSSSVWASKLTKDEKFSIAKYTVNYSVNEAVRECGTNVECHKKHGTEGALKQFSLMDAGLKKAGTLPEPVTVYRGVNRAIAKQLIAKFSEAAKKKQGYRLAGFVSTSANPAAAANFADEGGVVLKIKAKTGGYLSALNGGHSDEMELLQRHGTTYRVLGIKKRQKMEDRAHKMIHVSVVELEEV